MFAKQVRQMLPAGLLLLGRGTELLLRGLQLLGTGALAILLFFQG
jgi:hypothetical protein